MSSFNGCFGSHKFVCGAEFKFGYITFCLNLIWSLMEKYFFIIKTIFEVQNMQVDEERNVQNQLKLV